MTSDQNQDMELARSASLPSSRASTPALTNCDRLQIANDELKKYSILLSNVSHTINAIESCVHEDDPELTHLYTRQEYLYERRQAAVSEFSTLPRCDTPGCQIHSNSNSNPTPVNSPSKKLNEFPELPKINRPKRKESEDGFTSPTYRHTTKKANLELKNFNLETSNKFKELSQNNASDMTGNSQHIATQNMPNTFDNTTAKTTPNTLPPPLFRKRRGQQEMSWATIVDFYARLREVTEIIGSHHDKFLGAPETIKKGFFFLVDGEKKKDLWPRIARHCNPETSVICTDSTTQYHNVNKLFNDALHKTTNHKKGEFVNKTDKLNTINPLENENRHFKKSIINRKSEKSIRQYMALHFYRRTRLNTLKSLDAKVQMFLEDISWVFPGYGKEGLQLRKIEVPTVESEGISDMMPKTFNKNLLNGITFYIFFKKTCCHEIMVLF
ncbi:DDE_Tnp_IS1595 domain-containing protein [Trichonephila inaurata madagascariensis]|uniref:DDE_Tnp_IS1595 domain-containing protein n=1 Tax=Trichonephila inaurata madagascariensis TaxID=2747483 RepID=A0A8X7CI46_9ARAC|nr:DDE_Tnp_IS1595 domain-containing protein [Trichonephila inaurata madagascariensis]